MVGAVNQRATARIRHAQLLQEIEGLHATGSPVGLVLVRLDGLEQINAAHGYPVGDRILEAFGEQLAQVARDGDRSFAIAGKTFALLIHRPLHEGHAVLAAERLTRELEALQTGEERLHLAGHMGISMLPQLAPDAGQLLRQAETALRAARRRDANYLLYTGDLDNAKGDITGQTRFDVDEALKMGEFELYFQPKVALRSGQLLGAEGLLRWQSPGAGLMSPAQFIPAIENTRAIRSVLWFALNTALRNACDWQAQAPGLSVAVNVSPANLLDPDLVELVADALGVWGLAPERLVLEITETALMDDPAASASVMRRLRKLGVRLAIDDFGTGYSSLAYLRSIPAQELKIDRSFITPLQGNHRDRQIVASVVQLGHAVDMEVVAEGIEDMATLQTLVTMYCDVGQGYYFSKPLPAAEFESRWVARYGRRPVGMTG